tara:strand:- start:6808 stop:7260 length:453 start_codon:yes stop_codon:yes gene_type:complete
MTPKELENVFRKICRFDETLGFQFEVPKPGEAIYSFTVEDRHLASPSQCHGGVLAALMDATMGVAVLTEAVREGNLCSTVEFKINYLNRAKKGDLLKSFGEIEFKGARLVVAHATIRCGEKIIAKAMGTFSLYPADKTDIAAWAKGQSDE